MNDSALLPPHVTPKQFGDHFGLSERTVREKAQAIGACCIMGKKTILLSHHVEMLLEAMECRTSSIGAGKSGTTGALPPAGGYAALQERLTKRPRKGSRRKPKSEHGTVISMDRVRT